MIKILLLAVVPFMTQHRNVVPKTEVSTNFYGSVTGVVTTAYIQERSSVVLPQKWALANVTNANGKAVGAEDVGALPLSGGSLSGKVNGQGWWLDSGCLYIGDGLLIGGDNKPLSISYYGDEYQLNNTDGHKWFYGDPSEQDNEIAVKGDISSLSSSKADKSALTAHTENTDNPHGVTAGQIGAVQFVEDKNGNKTAVTIGSRISGDVGPGSIAHGHNVYAEGGYSYAAGYSASADGDYSRADGSFTQAFAEGSRASGIRASTRPEDAYSFAWNGNGNPDYGVYYSHGVGTFNINPLGGMDGFYIGDDNLAAILLSSVTNNISASNPTFSNAVLAVGLNIDTNSVAVLNEIAETFGGFPIEGTATTIGGLLAALASAIAWLKKNKVGSFKSVGGASATVENGVAELSNFFTESNSLLNGRLAYSRNETGLKDRAFNTLSFDGTEYNLSTALATVTHTASGQPRDLLIVATATAATTISFTAGTIKGDKPTIDGSGTWLITLTEYASGVWYCRQIKMEDAA